MRRFSTVMVGIFCAAAPPMIGGPAIALEPDAAFLAHEDRNAARWAEEDATIDEKLAALEARFGKKPNIIYVLADDVGWGELGW